MFKCSVIIGNIEIFSILEAKNNSKLYDGDTVKILKSKITLKKKNSTINGTLILFV